MPDNADRGRLSLTSPTVPRMDLQPIARISASRYHALLQCPLRAIWSSARQSPLLPVSPAARLGSVSHKVLELAGLGKVNTFQGLHKAWRSEVGNVEAEMSESMTDRHLVPLRKHAYRYEVKKRLTFAVAGQIVERRCRRTPVSSEDRKTESEVWLETEDGRLGGFVDLIVHRMNGTEIVDYKTGPVTEPQGEGDQVKVAYELQLSFYAVIYHEIRGEWPMRLTLKSLDGKAYNVPLDKGRCFQLAEDARKRQDRISEMIGKGIDQEHFATPAPDACCFCAYRPACRKYWRVRSFEPGWPLDVSGDLLEISLLGNGSLRTVIDSEQGVVAVRGLSPERFGFLEKDVKRVMLCNLGRDSSEGFCVQTPLTFGYVLER